ncbi:MAG: hypothetical protein ABI411_16880 [Tahibacter sp.]
MRRFSRAGFLWWAVAASAMFSGQLAVADIVIPAGAQWRVGDGAVKAGGADLRVAGQMQVQTGDVLGLRHLDVQPGGSVDNGSGVIQLAGDWRNAGNFTGASGGVQFVDGLGLTTAQVTGSSAFFDVSFLSSIGKRYVFVVGSVQSVAGLLGISGVTGAPIQFASSTAGQFASIDLLPSGTQNIAHIGVSDVHAVGQALAPTLINEGGTGNDNGWFGGGGPTIPPTPAPTLSPLSMMLLIALLAMLVRRRFSTQPSPVQGDRR